MSFSSFILFTIISSSTFFQLFTRNFKFIFPFTRDTLFNEMWLEFQMIECVRVLLCVCMCVCIFLPLVKLSTKIRLTD